MLIVSPPFTFVSSPGSTLSSAPKGISLAIRTSLTVPFLAFSSTLLPLSKLTAKTLCPVYSSATTKAPDNNNPDVAAAAIILPNFIMLINLLFIF